MPTLPNSPLSATGCPEGHDQCPLTLSLPRHALDEQLVLALAQRMTQPDAGWLAHGSLVLQAGWPQTWGLVGGLQAGAPRRLSALAAWPREQRHGSIERPAPEGLVLFYLAADGEGPPGADAPDVDGSSDRRELSAAWNNWLVRMAPDHRLATTALVPSLAVAWLRADGLLVLAFRPGDSLQAMAGGS